MEEDYERYFLSENPFPSSANMLVDSSDIRVNGTIFYEEIFQEEMASLRTKMETRTNVIYIAGLKFERGTGKSALLWHEWRRLQKEASYIRQRDFTRIYVKCTESPPNNKPVGFCALIVVELHRQGYLWEAFRRLLLKYVQDRPSLRLTRESVETLFNVYTEPPDTLPLSRYTHIAQPGSLALELAAWLSEKCGVDREVPLMLATYYLTSPTAFQEKYVGTRYDKITMYKDILKILAFAGFNRHYFLLDQMEDSIMATPMSRMGEFSSGMRRILEASMGDVTIAVTLHPDSETKLSIEAAKRFTSLAPLDAKHRVDVMTSESSLRAQVVSLAVKYMEHFRKGKPPTQTYPLDPEVIRYVCFLKDGNIRDVLQQLHECVKYGAMTGNSYIDMDFVLKHHRETMGTLINKELLDKFRKEAT